jgi:hypothetical protein
MSNTLDQSIQNNLDQLLKLTNALLALFPPSLMNKHPLRQTPAMVPVFVRVVKPGK